jgi:hypothetical protein
MGGGCRSVLAHPVDTGLRFLSIPVDSCLIRTVAHMHGAMRHESTKIDKTRKRVKARRCSGFATPCPVLARGSGIADRGSRIADCGLRIADRGSRIADCGWRMADRGLSTADLRIALWGLRIAPRRQSHGRPAGSVQP